MTPSTILKSGTTLTSRGASKPPRELPQVLFFIPRKMLDHCFRRDDLERLQPYYRSILPTSDSLDELAKLWQTHAPKVEAVVTGWDTPPITESMLADASHLQVIVHAAGSVRAIIPPSLWDSDIRVASANDALGKGVAETTLGLIIAGLKGFFACSHLTRQGLWQSAIPAAGYGRVRELFDVTIGIIGASKTGRHVIRLLREFDPEILLYDPTLSELEAAELGVKLVSLDTLMRSSDVVSLHAPALPALRHMLDDREFQVMKDDAIFINTARGMLVNEDALIAELKTGRISAILDVTSPEPPSGSSPFRTLPNVVLLPHIAGALSTGCLRMGRSAVEQLIEYRCGRELHGEITHERFKVMA